MLNSIEKYCSVVSMLLIAGAALIAYEGPVARAYSPKSYAAKTPGPVPTPTAPRSTAPASVSVIYALDEKHPAAVSKRIATD